MGWKHRLGKQSGTLNPYWKGGKSTFVCRSCGSEFLAYQSERDRGGAVFCSSPCLYSFTRKQVTKTCEICGKEFKARKCDIDDGKGRFCSKKCSAAWVPINRSGENSPRFGAKLPTEERLKRKGMNSGPRHYRWRGGVKSTNLLIRNSLEMKIWREAVFNRDDFTCQSCGVRGGVLNAHHIHPFATHPELRFDPDNGKTLCRACHLETIRRASVCLTSIRGSQSEANGMLVFACGRK